MYFTHIINSAKLGKEYLIYCLSQICIITVLLAYVFTNLSIDYFKIRLIYNSIIRRVLFDIHIFCRTASKDNDKQRGITITLYIELSLKLLKPN